MPDEVVSDTSPLQYLHQADCLELLPELYGTVSVPEAVAEEIRVGRSRGAALPHLEALDWIDIRPAPHQAVLPLAADLGPGEREVLSLALVMEDCLALLDDALARTFARHSGLRFTGTLGVLLKARESGLVERLAPIVDHLQSLGFWLDAATRRAVLDLAGES